MKIFLDTACPQELSKALSTPFVDGITTNPSLLAKKELGEGELGKEFCHHEQGNLYHQGPQSCDPQTTGYQPPHKPTSQLSEGSQEAWQQQKKEDGQGKFHQWVADQPPSPSTSPSPLHRPPSSALSTHHQEVWQQQGQEVWHEHAQELQRWGIQKSMFWQMARLHHLSPGPISLQVATSSAENMVTQGVIFSKLGPKAVVKVPATVQGFNACHELTQSGIDVNVTLCFSPLQGLLAAKAGARYISPFLGRLEDWIKIQNPNSGDTEPGGKLIASIANLLHSYNFKTQILAASIRDANHALQAFQAGADIVTLPPSVFWSFFHHPLTQSGLERFTQDWNAVTTVDSAVHPAPRT